MDGEQELSQLARVHAADRALLQAVRTPGDPGAVVASLLHAQAVHAALQTADGGRGEAHRAPAVGLEVAS